MQHILNTFSILLYRYTANKQLITSFWNKIEAHYQSNGRYYHNLSHIEELLAYFNEYNSNIKYKNEILFAIFYHDIIYDPKNKNNEEKSAEFAKKELQKLNIQDTIIKQIYNYIVATKHHNNPTKDNDLNYFLDFDMAILAKNSSDYIKYSKQIRKEYSIYPDFMYRKGRKKALQHFLKQDKIYKTDIFYTLYEEKARKNISMEIKSL